MPMRAALANVQPMKKQNLDASMPLAAFFLGGIIGTAQLAVMWGLVSNLLGPSVMDAAGWILFIVPVGAILGATAAAWLMRFDFASQGWSSFGVALGLATFVGFPAALIAPSALVGLGPDYQQYRLIVFVIEYSVAWLVMYFLFKPKRREL